MNPGREGEREKGREGGRVGGVMVHETCVLYCSIELCASSPDSLLKERLRKLYQPGSCSKA